MKLRIQSSSDRRTKPRAREASKIRDNPGQSQKTQAYENGRGTPPHDKKHVLGEGLEIQDNHGWGIDDVPSDSARRPPLRARKGSTPNDT
ncbi:hypothetical protein Tco_0644641 [Tanacetum coccineum]